MSNIKIYESIEFGKIRVQAINNNAWFCLKDLCEILEINNVSQLKTRLNQDGVITNEVIDNLGRKQKANFINESNLYKVIFQSRKEVAEKFTEWVTSEVLPSIRKNGGYILNQNELDEKELLAKAVIVSENIIKSKNKQLEEKEKKLEEQKPKVLFAEGVINNKGCILVEEMAKYLNQNGYKTGEIRLFRELRNRGFLNSRKGYADYNLPTQKSMDMKLFYIKKSIIQKPDGTEFISRVPMITGKGQVYFFNLFMKEVVRNENNR